MGRACKGQYLPGVVDRMRVPHLLACVAVPVLVGPLDRVEVCPVHIADDSFRVVIQRVTDFVRVKMMSTSFG